MNLYLFPHPETVDTATIDRWITLFPDDQQAYLGKLKSPRSRAEATLANMLLLAGLDNEQPAGSDDLTLHWVERPQLDSIAERLAANPALFPPFDIAERGKPYLHDTPDLFFNLSHCRTVVACVLHGSEVGVDVECRRPYQASFIRRVFSAEEQEQIYNSKDPQLTFVQLWTCKEAYVKYTGTGILGLDFLQGIPPHDPSLRLLSLPLPEVEGVATIIFSDGLA